MYNNEIDEKCKSFLKPLVQKIKSYIKDTTDFVKMIPYKVTVPYNMFLVTLDATNLYTNIANQEGTRACAKALLEARSQHEVPGIQTLMLLLRMVLTVISFEFNGAHYLQVGGTAMGTLLAPSYVRV